MTGGEPLGRPQHDCPAVGSSLISDPQSTEPERRAGGGGGGCGGVSRRQAALAASQEVVVAVPEAWATVWLRAAQRAGAVIVGEGEWRECAAAVGEPLFPEDFPAAPAYRCGVATLPVLCASVVHAPVCVCVSVCLCVCVSVCRIMALVAVNLICDSWQIPGTGVIGVAATPAAVNPACSIRC